jgi:hypothetical protein
MVNLGVDHRGVQRAVAQHVGHLLDRAAVVDDPASQGVPQGMAAAMRDARAPEGIAKDAADGADADGLVVGRDAAHEHRGVTGLGSFVPEVLLQGLPGDRRQGQELLAAASCPRARRCLGASRCRPVAAG